MADFQALSRYLREWLKKTTGNLPMLLCLRARNVDEGASGVAALGDKISTKMNTLDKKFWVHVLKNL